MVFLRIIAFWVRGVIIIFSYNIMEVKFTQRCDCDNLHYSAEYEVEGVGAFIIFMFICQYFAFLRWYKRSYAVIIMYKYLLRSGVGGREGGL